MTMRYKLFGSSGLRVSELCLGTLTFGEETGLGADKEESERVFRAFVEAGGNFLDTANRYNNGTSEQWTGDFIAGERDRFVVSTKYTLHMRPGDPNAGGNHRKSMMQAVEGSLRRLRTDYIDLYWLHQWDGTTSVEEVMRALDDLVRTGKVLYLGISDTPAWIVARGNTLAELRGWTPFVGLQVEYSLIERTVERELIPMARALGLAVVPWGALGGGVLSGKYHRAPDPKAPADTRRARFHEGTERVSERSFRIAEAVEAAAAELGRTPAQVALNWVRQQPGQIIPIIGARTEKQCRENLVCLDFSLEGKHLERLNEVSHVALGFPHEFLAMPSMIEMRHGGTQHALDWSRE
jgi:aryl-alcohol dehydrogenase-like predicted oxidoreductase